MFFIIDLLIAMRIYVGAVCDFRLSYGKILSRKSKIVIVNRNREQLLKVCYFMELLTLSTLRDAINLEVLICA